MKRGQAVTELALASLVFVTVLLFGVHFAEAGHAMLVLKQAAAYGAVTASGARTHDFSLARVQGGDTDAPFDAAAAGELADARFRRGGTFVLSQVEGLWVDCEEDTALGFAVANPGGLGAGGRAALASLRGVYRDRGGVSCTAEAWLTLLRVPSAFADGEGGFFAQAHAPRYALPLCGAGAPSGGECPGRLTLLTGDWALDGPPGSELNDHVPDVQAGDVRNRPFRAIVELLFEKSGGDFANARAETPGQRLLRIGGGMQPDAQEEWLDETRFAMSFRGDDPGAGVTIRRHRVDPNYEAALQYQTSGAALDNSAVEWNRETGEVSGVPRCFLGLAGCAASPARWEP